eukprot:112900-Prorocentrum_minimum.AAC.6
MALRKASLSAMRSVRGRGGGFWGNYPGGTFWSEGTQEASGAGRLFGESALPPGQTRVKEDWEMPCPAQYQRPGSSADGQAKIEHGCHKVPVSHAQIIKIPLHI